MSRGHGWAISVERGEESVHVSWVGVCPNGGGAGDAWESVMEGLFPVVFSRGGLRRAAVGVDAGDGREALPVHRGNGFVGLTLPPTRPPATGFPPPVTSDGVASWLQGQGRVVCHTIAGVFVCSPLGAVSPPATCNRRLGGGRGIGFSSRRCHPWHSVYFSLRCASHGAGERRRASYPPGDRGMTGSTSATLSLSTSAGAARR